MKQKTIRFFKSIPRTFQILWLYLYSTIAKVFGRKLIISYAEISDILILSDVLTFVWNGKGCYKVELSNGDKFSGFVKAIPLTFVNPTQSFTAKFYGIGETFEKTILINKPSISISISNIIETTVPKPVGLERRLNCLEFEDKRGPTLYIPTPIIRLPQFNND